jgi:hypothetical protein
MLRDRSRRLECAADRKIWFLFDADNFWDVNDTLGTGMMNR